MSEQNSGLVQVRCRASRDAGFTLPELLVSIIVLGSLVAVLSSALIVTFQQQDNTEGRLNVPRAEQNVSMWIPADLASADGTPSVLPDASPCSVNLFDLDGLPRQRRGILTGSNVLDAELDRRGVDGQWAGHRDDERLVSLRAGGRWGLRSRADQVSVDTKGAGHGRATSTPSSTTCRGPRHRRCSSAGSPFRRGCSR